MGLRDSTPELTASWYRRIDCSDMARPLAYVDNVEITASSMQPITHINIKQYHLECSIDISTCKLMCPESM